MRLPHESRDELNDEARAWELLAPWDVRPDNARLERHAVYTFNARYTEQWRVDRTFLAGDAAHQMPPFAGQGMCAGIRDAANLAWKLDLVLAGHGSPQLLDTYGQERLPSARQAIEFSMELGKVICVPDVDEAAARDVAMAAAVTDELAVAPDLPGIATWLIAPDRPHSGSLFGQGTVDGTGFDDAHGVGWRLVTINPDIDREGAIDPAAREWFESIGGRVVTLVDPDATYARWFSEHDTTAALQRPDFHLYGTATSAGDVSAMLHELHRHLTLPSTHQGVSG